ncbi:sigma 54 modulation protein/ribosomal protein S30EA [Alkaliphilus metalliredigens QYMF]|uniref:Ribosome hibernation promoting factor n=1 Tax=Alkaliphilus metalliredigens (strain QYMF) TaxID=293826 RepID=A6TLE5_ALKMQ|nr:ribosome-associated translation inhibitor RaiA [Alkaliphilus metalliredigens]ABR47013.1 sigma 54 modulation protein/ribosomal protein S30EA [Alkaliphilus metalliredigens QYMF]
MKVIVSGKNVQVTDALRDMVQTKLGKLDKYFNKEVEAQATLSVQKSRQIIEITIPFDGSILRAEEKTEDMYASIDGVVNKLTSQLRKHKTKMENKTKKYETIRFENIPTYVEDVDSDESKIVKTKRFAMKPMHSEEAVLQMELIGHNFYMFANAETDEVNVVYKRKDGNYGLIEPEF